MHLSNVCLILDRSFFPSDVANSSSSSVIVEVRAVASITATSQTLQTFIRDFLQIARIEVIEGRIH